jgi:hypothetical protein
MTLSPSNIDMKGNDEEVHDGLSDADHEAQLHGDDQKNSSEGEDHGNQKEEVEAQEDEKKDEEENDN